MQLNGKVAVVTGGARGIGKAIANAFAERGATLALLDLNQADLDATRAEFEARGVKVSGHALNVAKEDEVIRALDAVVAAHGRLDVLVNNAGIIKDAVLVKVKDGAIVSKMSLAQLDLNQADLDATRAGFEARGVKVSSHALNVAKEDEVIRALDAVVAAHGRLDVLVNNAGIIKDAVLVKVKDGAIVSKMTLAQWQAVIDVNLTGVFLCGREAAERMIKLGQGGVIINISSISRAGNAGQSNYSAAKAGVAAMATTWAKELARFGIRAGAIAPGFIKTDILSGMPPEMLEKMTTPVPLKRLGLAEEIAHTALFIVENDFFSGRCIDVDGGLRL